MRTKETSSAIAARLAGAAAAWLGREPHVRAAQGGSGLRGLTDRVEALGARLMVSSPPGLGTTLRAELPCA